MKYNLEQLVQVIPRALRKINGRQVAAAKQAIVGHAVDCGVSDAVGN